MLEAYRVWHGQHCRAYGTLQDAEYARHFTETMDTSAQVLGAYFQTPIPPGLRGILAPCRSEYERLVTELLGVPIELPSHPGRIAQPQGTDLVFLSPAAYAEHSHYPYDQAEFGRLVFHEMTHVFEECLSPDIERQPLWWSEGLAVYLSGQWRFDSPFRFREPVAESIMKGIVPELPRLEADWYTANAWGWTLVMYIERQWGREMVAEAVKHCQAGAVLDWITDRPRKLARDWKRWLLGSGREAILLGKQTDER